MNVSLYSSMELSDTRWDKNRQQYYACLSQNSPPKCVPKLLPGGSGEDLTFQTNTWEGFTFETTPLEGFTFVRVVHKSVSRI